MMSVIWEVFLYLVFIYLVYMVSLGNRHPDAFTLYNSLHDEFHEAVYVPDDGVAMSEVSAIIIITVFITRG